MLDVRDSRGRTALFYAARKGMFGIMSFLLNHGADINARDDTDNSLFRSTLSRLTPLPGAGNAVAAAGVAVGAAARITTLARRVSSASEKHLGSPRNQVSRMAFFTSSILNLYCSEELVANIHTEMGNCSHRDLTRDTRHITVLSCRII